jgi:DNA-binding NtrC family response regulator
LQGELDMEGAEPALGELPPPENAKALLEAARQHLQGQKAFDLDLTLRQWERGYIDAALALTHGNLTQAAKLLGIHRTTLYSRIQSYVGHAERDTPAP